MEYIINECTKQAENYKRRNHSPKKEKKEQEIKENEKEKEKDNNYKHTFATISNEKVVEEKKETIPMSNNEEKNAAEINNNSNILNKIIDSIDEDHELDDKDIDQYINSKD